MKKLRPEEMKINCSHMEKIKVISTEVKSGIVTTRGPKGGGGKIETGWITAIKI